MIRNSQRGASLVEYALLIAMIAVLAMGAVSAVGNKSSQKFSLIASTLN